MISLIIRFSGQGELPQRYGRYLQYRYRYCTVPPGIDARALRKGLREGDGGHKSPREYDIKSE